MKKCLDCGTNNTSESNFCIVCSSENLIEVGDNAPPESARIFPASKSAHNGSAQSSSRSGFVPVQEAPEEFTFTDGPPPDIFSQETMKESTNTLPPQDTSDQAATAAAQKAPTREREEKKIIRQEQGGSAPEAAAATAFAAQPFAPRDEQDNAVDSAGITDDGNADTAQNAEPVTLSAPHKTESAEDAAEVFAEPAVELTVDQWGEPSSVVPVEPAVPAAALTEYVAEATSQSGDVICPYCKNSMIASTDVFCPSCGRNVEQINYKKIIRRKKCPQCGTSNEINNHTCTYCFTPLDTAEQDIFTVDYIDAARDGGDIIHKAVLVSQTGKKWQLCAGCGALSELSESICSKCANKLEVVISKKYCPNCGSENTQDAQFCYHCRFSFAVGVVAEGVWRCGCSQLNDESSIYCIKCGKLYAKKK